MMNAYIKKRKISNNLITVHQGTRKDNKLNLKLVEGSEARKITMEITDTETRETTEKKLTAIF